MSKYFDLVDEENFQYSLPVFTEQRKWLHYATPITIIK